MKKIYIEHLVRSMKIKEKLSIQEFSDTNLNNADNLSNISEMFSSIYCLIRRMPPEKYVKCVEFFVNSRGEIKLLKYKYFQHNEEIYDSDFIINYLME